MNFFDAQDQARRATRRLVILYLLATALIVLGVTFVVGAAMYVAGETHYARTVGEFVIAESPLLVATAILTAVFIVGASLYKTSVLAAGGSRVAMDMGGTPVTADTRDPLRRRLRNVVEEMAIASSVSVPEIFVLEKESGINAFAAGYTTGDAVIAVTRGTLKLLERDELQGVIAHEFSHILNGDMRLNIRLMGILFGIMSLGLIGRMIIRGGHPSMLSSRRSRGALPVLIVGLGLAVLGGIGVLFARIIKAGVSRQREFLADASAVQFTRQTSGIANALKKIGGYDEASYLRAADAEEISHMLFGSGAKLSGLFATHPPLTERIQALDPDFRDSDYPAVNSRQYRAEPDQTAMQSFAPRSADALQLPTSISDSVGHPAVEHVAFAQQIRRSIPASLYEAAHSHEYSYLLTIALILDRDGRTLDRQLALAEEQFGAERARLIRRYYDELAQIGAEYRLPILEIAFPALKHRPAPQLEFLITFARRVIELDGEIDLYEYCFYRVLQINLGYAVNPSRRRTGRKASRKAIRRAAVKLLRVIADRGHDSDAEREAAFHAGLDHLGKWAMGTDYRADRTATVTILDQSLDLLQALGSKGRQSLLEAIGATVSHDGRVSIVEAELTRMVCATLECPLPPILADNQPT